MVTTGSHCELLGARPVDAAAMRRGLGVVVTDTAFGGGTRMLTVQPEVSALRPGGVVQLPKVTWTTTGVATTALALVVMTPVALIEAYWPPWTTV